MGGDFHSLIERREEERLRASARATRDSDPVGIDLGKRLNEVEGANTTPSLEGEGLGVVMLPSKMTRIAVSDHIIGKNNGPHSSEGGASVLLVGPISASRRTGSVTVGTEDAGMLSELLGGAVEVAVDEESGPSLKCRRFDRVAFIVAFRMDDRLESGALGKRVETGSDQDLLANPLPALLPLREIGVGGQQAVDLLNRLGLGMVMPPAEEGFVRSLGRGGGEGEG